MNSDQYLPAVIDTEGVDSLTLCDQFERTIRWHQAHRKTSPITGIRWCRLAEAHDRFAAHAGVTV